MKNAQGWVNQNRLGSIGKYFPYGEERPSATANGKEKFATYTRDAETGLDYAQNRYHSVGQGRFMTADPYQASAGVEDPGSWNRYVYVGGDPINYVDSSGLEKCYINGDPIKCPPLPPPPQVPLGGGKAPPIDYDPCVLDASSEDCKGPPQRPNLCPEQPSAPTRWTLLENVETAEKIRGNLAWLNIVAGGRAISEAIRIQWFYVMVRNKGPMDYKQVGPYEAFGNFNFGAVGAALGLSLEFIQRAAGYAQVAAGTSLDKWGKPTGKWPYGDDPDDSQNIALGYAYYQRLKEGCDPF